MNIKPQTIECVGGLTITFDNGSREDATRVKVTVGATSWVIGFGSNAEVKRITHTREFQLTDDDPRRND